MNEVKIMLSVVILLLLSVLQIGVRAKKNRRIRQFPLIVIALVYAGIGIYNLLPEIRMISELSEVSVLLMDAEILAVNVLLAINFVVVRWTLRPLCSLLCSSSKLLDLFSLGIYSYDDEYDEWFLKKQWMNFRKYFFVLVICLDIASGVFLGLTWVMGKQSDIWLLIFPCAAIMVVNEIYSFVSGQTKEEFEYSVIGDDADARRISNFYKLREILEQILSESLLSAHTGSEFVVMESAAELLRERRETGNEIDKITAEYFESDGRYKVADVDCVQAAFQMMHRRNVVFFNPFYRDLSMYITLPLISALLSGKKCVVLCGRKAVAEDIKEWISYVLKDYSHMRSMWRVNYLSDKEPECEVGIITFTQIYDKRVINTNREFFNETDFVLLIEPSMMLNTSQIALSIIAEEMSRNGEAPVYCICDRKVDGLIDTMSHLLHAEITDVVAMPVPRCNYTAMGWDADGDFCRQQLFNKQTKYLGDGLELAAIAVKNQVPKVSWYSATKVPVKDIKWIAGQYYATICRYMNQPSQQKSLYEKIDFFPNLWSAKQSQEEFIIAEDEFCNMFSMMRVYLSRGKKQTFVNVLSENYLLRDYMRCNRQMFMSDPNAVPVFVPDYAKTERNIILKLILMMVLRPVSDAEVRKELHLVGIETDDALGIMLNLVQKYTYADSNLFTVQSVRKVIDEFTTISSCIYSITDEAFDRYFSDSLKNAYYILEDEKNEEGYIDAKLFNHVTQTILPGQFVTYDGKYYMAKHVSPQSGVVLRRASNLFDGRKYYRQVRTYCFDKEQGEIVSIRRIGDIEFAEIRTDMHVDTTGYLEMSDSHNLRTANLIDYSEDPSVPNYSRKYHNKSVLRIKLPDADEKIRFTLCLLLSEVFRTIFPDGWQYLAMVMKRSEDIGGMLNYMVYSAEGYLDEEYIYVIEDSDIDLGLINAVEKNFMKIMEIITDFLEWHFEKMREPASKDPIPAKIAIVEAEEKKKRNRVVSMLDRVRRLFGGKKEESVEVDDRAMAEETAEEPADTVEAQGEAGTEQEYSLDAEHDAEANKEKINVSPVDENQVAEYSLVSEEQEKKDAQDIEEVQREMEKQSVEAEQLVAVSQEEHLEDEFEPTDVENPDLVAIDGTDIFENDGAPEDNDYLESSFIAMGVTPITKSRYQRECFLKFGFDEIDNRIRIDELQRYLRVRGRSNNSLTKARKRDVLSKTQTDIEAVNYCDFCGMPLTGVSYERLRDGVVRCNDCSSSAIKSMDEFKDLFYRTFDLVEGYFDIRYRTPIRVKMTDSRTITKGAGMVYKPTTQMTSRVIGFAQYKHGKYSVMVENGSPKLATINTLVHEMTHIWQFINWSERKVMSIYSVGTKQQDAIAKDIVYEGMAMWASIQYLYQIGETYYASQQEALAEIRKDAYGFGFRLYKEQYPLMKDSTLLKYSPFSTFPTLEPDAVRAAVYEME